MLFQGFNGSFVLLATSKFEGIRAFQYNGWRFVKSDVQYKNGAFSTGAVSLHSYFYEMQPVVGTPFTTIITKNCRYTVKFFQLCLTKITTEK